MTDAAEREVREAVERAPDDGASWKRLGLFLRYRWRLAEAESALAQATTLEPEDADAWAALASVQIARGRVDDGLVTCRRASRIQPALAAASHHRARALLSKGRFLDAWLSAAEARRLDPSSPEIATLVATFWARVGLKDGARRLLDRVIASIPTRRPPLWPARACMSRQAPRRTRRPIWSARSPYSRGSLPHTPRVRTCWSVMDGWPRPGRRSRGPDACIRTRKSS